VITLFACACSCINKIQRHFVAHRPITGDVDVDEKFRQLLKAAEHALRRADSFGGAETFARFAQARAELLSVEIGHENSRREKEVAPSAMPVHTERP
jgi:hypothetical protein